MATQWFCRIMGDESGPMTSSQLVDFARDGRLSRNDTVRQGPNGTWVRAETVGGLFNSMQVATTATTKQIAHSLPQATPARRSVQQLRVMQYWIKHKYVIVGPISGDRVRELASQGKLLPHHMISSDQKHWLAAGLVKGITFCSPTPTKATASIRSAVLIEKPLSECPEPVAAL